MTGTGLLVSCLGAASLLASATAASAQVRRLSPEFVVNSTSVGPFSDPAVTRLSNGDFAVAWNTVDAFDRWIMRTRIFDHLGRPRSGDILVTAPTIAVQSDVDIARTGPSGFVAVWGSLAETGADRSGWAVRAQRFDGSGARIGSAFDVNRFVRGDQHRPEADTLADGRWAVSFDCGDTGGSEIRTRSFSQAGAGGPELRASTAIRGFHGHSALAGLSTGGAAITWFDHSQTGADTQISAVRAQAFTPQGGKLGPEVLVNTTTRDRQWFPDIASIGAGRYVVVWEDLSRTGGDTSDSAIRGQVLSAAGAKLGAEFLVPTSVLGRQITPAVAGFGDGKFVVAWQHETSSIFDFDIRAQAFRWSAGSVAPERIGSEFRASQGSLAIDRGGPAVAAFEQTDFVIVWSEDRPAFGAPDLVKGQVYRIERQPDIGDAPGGRQRVSRPRPVPQN
jgi:hypothetical protein